MHGPLCTCLGHATIRFSDQEVKWGQKIRLGFPMKIKEEEKVDSSVAHCCLDTIGEYHSVVRLMQAGV